MKNKKEENQKKQKEIIHIPQIGSMDDRKRAGDPVPDEAGSMS